MNNLHRELAPISDAAWTQIEEETSRTLKRYLAGRRVVDLHGPQGPALSAVGTGHMTKISAPDDGITAHQREAKALVERPLELERRIGRRPIEVVRVQGNPADRHGECAAKRSHAASGGARDVDMMHNGTNGPNTRRS